MVDLKSIETEKTMQIYFPENSVISHLKTALDLNGITDYKLLPIKRAVAEGVITQEQAEQSPWYQDKFFRMGACVLVSHLNSKSLDDLHNSLLNDKDLINANMGSVKL